MTVESSPIEAHARVEGTPEAVRDDRVYLGEKH